MLLLMMIMIMMIMMGYIFAADSIYICYTSDRNVPLWLVQIASRGVS